MFSAGRNSGPHGYHGTNIRYKYILHKKKDKIMSNIKERVLLIAESKRINKTTFFKDLGLSYANFKGIQKASALSSEAVAIILSKYHDISPAWLIAGEGNMYREDPIAVQDKTERYVSQKDEGTDMAVIDALYKVIDALETTVRSQEKTITFLEKQLSAVEKEIMVLKKN